MVDTKFYRKWAKDHPNFMTPEIKSLREVAGVYIIELSEGDDFDHKPLYGVTALKMEGSSFKSLWQVEGLNKCFSSLTDAKTHMDQVEDRLNESKP